jgi:uncharacterized protein (TIGR03437 family)
VLNSRFIVWGAPRRPEGISTSLRPIAFVISLLVSSLPAFASRQPAPNVWFERNDGPAQTKFPYRARLRNYSLLLSGSELAVHFAAKSPDGRGSSVGIEFAGASRHAASFASRLPGRVNDFVGADPRSWRKDVPIFESVRFHALYRGIDVLYRGDMNRIEYDFLVSPGADPRKIRMRLRRAGQIGIQPDGSILISAAGGKVRQSRPIAYQEWDGIRHTVEAEYVWRGHAIGIRVGPYDRARSLVIDPVVVADIGLFGGNGQDEGDAIATDNAGAVYIAGYTDSYNFPVTPGAADTSLAMAGSAFATKLTADGTIVYSTFLPGKASGIAVDQSGSAYVIASTYVGLHTGLADGIQVTKLSPSGDAIVYQTSLPGPGLGRGIAVDAQGDAYITGSTQAANFPITSGAFQTQLLSVDAFVAKLDPTGHVNYATYLGGSGDEEGRAIAVDSSGDAYVTGVAHNSTDFPAVNAAQPAAGGAFIYRTDDGGSTWTTAGNGIKSAVGVLTVDPTNGSIVYAALSSGGLVKTTDSGATWTVVGSGLGTQGLSSLAVDPLSPATLYAADGNTLYKSVDGGSTWKNVGAATPLTTNSTGGPVLVAVDPAHSGVLYATRSWAAKSVDGGTTWQMLPGAFNSSIQQFAVDPSNTSRLYLSGYETGFRKSVDGGSTWTSLGYASYFAISPTGSLYVSDGISSTSRSNDGGVTWQTVGGAAPEGAFSSLLAADPVNSGVIYCWGGSGYESGASFPPGDLYKLSSASTSWQTISLPLSGEAAPSSGSANYGTNFATAPSTPNRLYYAAAPGWDAFVAKINPTGTELIYSTYLGGISNDYGNAIALDAGANVYVAGATASANFPVTPSSFQTAFGGGSAFPDPRLVSDIGVTSYSRGTDAFVAKLDAGGTHFAYASYLGGSNDDWGLGLSVDSSGNALVAGYTVCSTFPTMNDGFKPQTFGSWSAFLSQIAPDGSQLKYSTCFGGTGGVAATGVALDPAGDAFLTGLGSQGMSLTPNAGSAGSVLFTGVQFPATAQPVIANGGMVDVFTYDPSRISPGALISIFGTGLANSTASAQMLPWPATLGGASVTIGGIAAPLFYANAGQINLQVPWEITPGVSQVVVTTANGSSVPASMTVQLAAPAIAVNPDTGHALAVNQDSTLNSDANPAPAGSILTLYLTGQGPVSNTPATGWPAPASPPATVTSSAGAGLGIESSAVIAYSGQLIYFGLSPGTVGLAQANVLLPNVPPGDYFLVLESGGSFSNFATVSIGAAK